MQLFVCPLVSIEKLMFECFAWNLLQAKLTMFQNNLMFQCKSCSDRLKASSDFLLHCPFILNNNFDISAILFPCRMLWKCCTWEFQWQFQSGMSSSSAWCQYTNAARLFRRPCWRSGFQSCLSLLYCFGQTCAWAFFSNFPVDRLFMKLLIPFFFHDGGVNRPIACCSNGIIHLSTKKWFLGFISKDPRYNAYNFIIEN